jgi:serine/threonine protein kinase, bacterial
VNSIQILKVEIHREIRAAASLRPTLIFVSQPVSARPTTKVLVLRPNEARELGRRYRVRRLIGRGGMSDVYLGDDLLLERPVAIKVMHQNPADPMGLERFRREATTLAAVRSPHVVAIYDIGVEGNDLYLVMQHIEGHTIEQEIARSGPMTLERAQAVLLQVLDGLAEMHSQGLVHRDIKPSNVILDLSDHVVLLDLGIVLDTRRAPLTAPGMVAGTPGYLAPETRASAESEFTSDVYQVGLLMVFMLTAVDTGLRAYNCGFEALFTRMPSSLVKVARTALACDPAERFGSAAIMKHAVIAALAAPAPRTLERQVAPRGEHRPILIPREPTPSPRPTEEIGAAQLRNLLTETCPTRSLKPLVRPAARLELVEPVAPMARGTILIVDEDTKFATTLQRMLFEHDVSVVPDSRQAVARIVAGERFHVIVCGRTMPVSLHEGLLAACPQQAAVIVFLTGGIATTRQTRALMSRVANRSLGMPFDIQLLKELIDAQLRAP